MRMHRTWEENFIVSLVCVQCTIHPPVTLNVVLRAYTYLWPSSIWQRHSAAHWHCTYRVVPAVSVSDVPCTSILLNSECMELHHKSRHVIEIKVQRISSTYLVLICYFVYDWYLASPQGIHVRGGVDSRWSSVQVQQIMHVCTYIITSQELFTSFYTTPYRVRGMLVCVVELDTSYRGHVSSVSHKLYQIKSIVSTY